MARADVDFDALCGVIDTVDISILDSEDGAELLPVIRHKYASQAEQAVRDALAEEKLGNAADGTLATKALDWWKRMKAARLFPADAKQP